MGDHRAGLVLCYMKKKQEGLCFALLCLCYGGRTSQQARGPSHQAHMGLVWFGYVLLVMYFFRVAGVLIISHMAFQPSMVVGASKRMRSSFEEHGSQKGSSILC